MAMHLRMLPIPTKPHRRVRIKFGLGNSAEYPPSRNRRCLERISASPTTRFIVQSLVTKQGLTIVELAGADLRIIRRMRKITDHGANADLRQGKGHLRGSAVDGLAEAVRREHAFVVDIARKVDVPYKTGTKIRPMRERQPPVISPSVTPV